MDMDFDSNIDDWNEDIDLVEEDWEALNGNRWYQENPAISYRTDAVASEGGTTLDDWQRSIRNVRREIDIGGKTLQEVESAASRVRFGEVFSSFKEFEFSVDCWCVINMRSSSKFKTKSNMRVRVCRFGLAVRKKGMGNIREWPGNSESQPVSQRDVPHVLGVRSFNDFNRRMRTPSIPVVRPDRPDLNLHNQDFVASTPRRMKKRCSRGECGEKPRYDAAAMVRTVNDDAEEEEEEDIGEFNVGYEGEDEEGCKGSKKPQQQAQRCEWRVRCTMGKRNSDIKITTLNLNHTCPSHLHMWRGPLSKAPWLAEVFGDKVVVEYKRPIGQLQSEFRRQFHRDVQYQPIYRMRDICQDMIAGCQMESFAQIPALCERIQDADPDGLVDWDTFENSYTFRRAFICPSATRGILRYCEKVVALDACFTKNKKYPTQLFLASVVDGNSQIFPLAYAVAPVENYENWSWFVHNLHISIQGLRSEAVMIVSDRQKGLERAVTEVLPCNPHMHCGHHLKMNVQKLFGKTAVQVFQNLLHAKSEDRFNSVMEEAETRLDQGSEFKRYIQRIDPARYALYAMSLPRYGRTTSNAVESMNAALKRIRDYPPCRIICQMWLYLLNLFCERREKANRSTNELTDYCKERMEEFGQNCGSFVCMSADMNQALVQTDGGLKQWIVKRTPKAQCTCIEPHDHCWPCIHFMSWLRSRGEDYMAYVDRIYLQKSLVLCYSKTIPVIMETELAMSISCRAPPPAIRTGRHRVVRIPNGGSTAGASTVEFEYPLTQEPRVIPAATIDLPTGSRGGASGRRNTGGRCCGVCREAGHNRTRCPVLAHMA
ncbi:hypothetical protein R1sor_020878 [Riccia sorocarpa]|uniref:MULE transposase domain-containing protein n=1 Tax=Riccia sorocarpa TaxID=122646 RepID=A0ABD3GH85_9MARC